MNVEQRKIIKRLIEKMERGSLLVPTVPEVEALKAMLDTAQACYLHAAYLCESREKTLEDPTRALEAGACAFMLRRLTR